MSTAAPAIDLEIEQITPVSGDTGKPTVARFIRAFHPSGLHAVVAKAREAESADGRSELWLALDAADKQLAAIGPTDPARFKAKELRDQCWVRCERESAAAASASNRIWTSEWAVKLIASDLNSLLKKIDAEMHRIIDLQTRFARENELDADVATLKAFSPLWQAFNEFRTRHLEPAVAEYEFRKEFPESFGNRTVEQVSWVLAGCGWRQVNLSK